MRKQIEKMVLGIVLAVSCLTGCGGEQAAVVESGAAGSAVSKGAVSGGAVSGSAVSESESYMFCNDVNFYYSNKEDILVEHNRKTGKERELKIKNAPGECLVEEICYADQEWVYFSGMYEAEEENRFCVWRIPVGEGSCAVEGAEERILEEKERGNFDPYSQNVWCDGTYIIYLCRDKNEWRQYSIREKTYIKSERMEACSKETELSSIDGMCGGYAVISDGDFSEVVLKKLDSDEVVQISKSAYMIETQLLDQTDFYWADAEADGTLDTLWQCHLQEHEKRQLVTKEQLQAVLEKEELLKPCQVADTHTACVNNLFSREGWLYIEAAIRGYGKDVSCENRVVLRIRPGEPESLQLDTELTKCLHNPEDRQKAFYKQGRNVDGKKLFKSRGCILAMTRQACIMFVEYPEKKANTCAYYDFSNKEFHYISKEDEEWWTVQDYGYGNNFPDSRSKWYSMGVDSTVPNNDSWQD